MLAVLGHEFGDMDRLAEDGITALIPEILIQIEVEVADKIIIQRSDNRQLVSADRFLREIAVGGGGNGPVLQHPFGLEIIIGYPDGGVVLGSVHNGVDPAEKVVFLQGCKILGVPGSR